MTQQEEQWLFVDGTDCSYSISSLGRVRSNGRKVWKEGRNTLVTYRERILKVSATKAGYISTDLGKRNKKLIHRLVAQAFIPNPENKPCVNHIDGNKANNAVSNLEWATASENELHSYRVLGKVNSACWTGKRGYDNPSSKTVIQYDLNGSMIAEYGSASLAAESVGTTQGRISCNCRGETRVCKGFIFKYKTAA